MSDTAFAFAAGIVIATIAWPVAIAAACYLGRVVRMGNRHLPDG